MTELQQAIADGVAAISAAQAGVWSFGSFVFEGAEGDLKVHDPRMIGAVDRLIEIRVITSSLISSYPKRGQEITRGGETYKIHRVDHISAPGVSLFLASRTSLPASVGVLSFLGRVSSFLTYGNAAGDTVIACPASGWNTAQVTFSGTASVRNLILPAGPVTGAVLNLVLIFPPAAGIDARARNLSVGGTLLYELVTDASGSSAEFELVWSGIAWTPGRSIYPA